MKAFFGLILVAIISFFIDILALCVICIEKFLPKIISLCESNKEHCQRGINKLLILHKKFRCIAGTVGNLREFTVEKRISLEKFLEQQKEKAPA